MANASGTIPFNKIFITGYRLDIPGATGKEFWHYKAPSIRAEIDLRAKIRQLPEETRDAYYNYMLWELAYTFQSTGLPSPESPTEHADAADFKPLVKPGTPEEVYAQLEALPVGLLGYLWENVKSVVPSWGPRLSRFKEGDADEGSF